MNLRTAAISSIIMLALFFEGCASTTVTSVWKSGDFGGPPMHSVMILAQTAGEYTRLSWENNISERFRRNRMIALPAVRFLPENSNASLGQALIQARKQGVEGVLVIRYVDTRTEERYHPPETEYYYPWRDYYPLWREYYPGHRGRYRRPHSYYRYYPYSFPYFYSGQEVVIRPGYTTYHRVILIESYLYQVSSGEQVWSMSTETFDPRSNSHLVADISRTVFQVLQKYNLIRPAR